VLLACVVLGLPGCEAETPPVDSPAPEPAPVPQPVVEAEPEPEAAPVPPGVAGLAPRYQKFHGMLANAEVLTEWKLEIVLDDLAPDESGSATTVLILTTRNESIPVSMASLKVLATRMDDRVEAHLVTLLEDASWERRAWSARILGQTGRHRAHAALREILPAETDPRVRRQIEQAVAALDAGTAPTDAAGPVQGTDDETGDAGG
jgi:hypothetical protein